MRYSRGRDILKSLASFGVVGVLFFVLLDQLIEQLLKPTYIKDHIPDDVIRSLDPGRLDERAAQIAGYIHTVAWGVFAVTQAIALIWLIYAWSVRIYKPGMARGHFVVYIIVLLVGAVVGLQVALDGYLWCLIQTGLYDMLIRDLRVYLVISVTAYCVLSSLLTTAIAVPPVMRPATLGGTFLGRITDTLRIWEV